MAVVCEAAGDPVTISPSTITEDNGNTLFTLNGDAMTDGQRYPDIEGNGSFLFFVTDEASNTVTITADPFTYDNTAPLITSVTVAPDNSYILVTFADDLYLFNASEDNLDDNVLVTSDFSLSVVEGTATLSPNPRYIKDSDGSAYEVGGNEFRLGLNLTGTPDGNEVITVLPSDGASIYDAAGNVASLTQTNNSVNLVDETAPILTQDGQGIGDPITFDGNVVNGTNYVRDNTPTVSLTVTDAYNETINIPLTLTCTVDGIEVDITPKDYLKGIDTQLDRGIKEILSELKKSPVVKPVFDNKPNLSS